MKLQIPFLTFLVSTALAFPLLAPRVDTCPTYSRWEQTLLTTSWRTTSIATIYLHLQGSITSTETRYWTGTITHVSTVISPPTTTIPISTLTTTVAESTETLPWWTVTSTVRIPDYSPEAFCQLTTTTHIIPGITRPVHWENVTYIQSWQTITHNVSTVDVEYKTTTTRTTTVPGTTTYAATVTRSVTYWVAAASTQTDTTTVYEKGCKTYACQG